ncbi:AAA family ATPase, partial [Mycobacterium gordonae]
AEAAPPPPPVAAPPRPPDRTSGPIPVNGPPRDAPPVRPDASRRAPLAGPPQPPAPPASEPPPAPARRRHRYLPDPESGEDDPQAGTYFRVPMPPAPDPKPGHRPTAQPPRQGGRRRAPSGPIPVRPRPAPAVAEPRPAPPSGPPAPPAPMSAGPPPAPTRARRPAPAPTQPPMAPAPEPRQAPPQATKQVPQRGWRGALYKFTRINAGLSRDEKYEQDLRARVSRKARGSYQIGMLGLKGGVGKTTTTVTLGTMLAQVRGDRILVLDADPGCGNLAERAGRTSPSSIADLVADENLSHYNDVRAHTSVNAHNLEILPTAEYTTARRGLSGEDLRFAVDTVSKFYNLVLADCGPGLFDPVTRGVLETASAIVIVTNVSLDSARQAESALEWLRNNGYQDLLSRVVVVINHVAVGETNVAEKQLVRQFQQLVQPNRVVLLPWDKHIAEGTEIQLDRLGPVYRRRVLELAAALSDDFERAGRR